MNVGRKTIAIAATALGAAGLLTVAAPANAEPCGEWGMGGRNGVFTMHLDNGVEVAIRFEGSDARGQSSYILHYQTDRTYGTATGGIFGTRVDINAHWTDGPGAGLSNQFYGDVTEDGRATGTSVNSLGTPNTWKSGSILTCLIPASQIPPPELPR
jgi:hypothetical protein